MSAVRNTRSSARLRQSQRRRAAPSLVDGIEAEIDACHRLSGFKRAAEFVFFAALYATGAIVVNWFPDGGFSTVTGVVVMGIAMNSLGILIHEGLHGLLARDARINQLLSFLCGLPLLISASAYRATHCDHHFDFGRKLDFGTYRQHLNNRCFVWSAYYAQLLCGSILYVLLIPILAWRTASGRTRRWIALEYLLIGSVLGLCLLFAAPGTLLLYWLYPSLVLMLLSNIRGLASHALGDLEDIYLSSRTVNCSPLVALLFLHENYHLEHHLFPQIPSYHLKRAHQLIWHRLPRALVAGSYLSFLLSFFRASFRFDLSPVGRVTPSGDSEYGAA